MLLLLCSLSTPPLSKFPFSVTFGLEPERLMLSEVKLCASSGERERVASVDATAPERKPNPNPNGERASRRLSPKPARSG